MTPPRGQSPNVKLDKVNGHQVPMGTDPEELAKRVLRFDPSWRAAMEALARDESEAAENILLRFAYSNQEYIRRSAIECLGQRKSAPQHSKVFLNALNDSSQLVIRSACYGAVLINLLEALPRMIELLKSPSAATRQTALSAIRILGGHADYKSLREFINGERDKVVRDYAARTLMALVSTESWKDLFDFFSAEGTPSYMVWACELVLRHGGISHLQLVAPLLYHKNGHVRKAASRVVREIELLSE